MSQFDAMAKPFHTGCSAEAGIFCANLTGMGFTAAETVLKMRCGIYQAYTVAAMKRLVSLSRLGSPWAFVDCGVWLKPWPMGSLGHPAMTKTQELVTKYDINPDDVAHIRVRTSKSIHDVQFHHRPTRELEAKFSMEFPLAALLLERRAALKQFSDEYVTRDDVQAVIRKVDYTIFDEAEAKAGNHTIVTSLVEIEMQDGRKFAGRIDFGKGSKANPICDDEVADKFRGCADFVGWPESRTEDAIALVRNLESQQDTKSLMACLSR